MKMRSDEVLSWLIDKYTISNDDYDCLLSAIQHDLREEYLRGAKAFARNALWESADFIQSTLKEVERERGEDGRE
jgi:hypothetical protein